MSMSLRIMLVSQADTNGRLLAGRAPSGTSSSSLNIPLEATLRRTKSPKLSSETSGRCLARVAMRTVWSRVRMDIERSEYQAAFRLGSGISAGDLFALILNIVESLQVLDLYLAP